MPIGRDRGMGELHPAGRAALSTIHLGASCRPPCRKHLSARVGSVPEAWPLQGCPHPGRHSSASVDERTLHRAGDGHQGAARTSTHVRPDRAPRLPVAGERHGRPTMPQSRWRVTRGHPAALTPQRLATSRRRGPGFARRAPPFRSSRSDEPERRGSTSDSACMTTVPTVQEKTRPSSPASAERRPARIVRIRLGLHHRRYDRLLGMQSHPPLLCAQLPSPLMSPRP